MISIAGVCDICEEWSNHLIKCGPENQEYCMCSECYGGFEDATQPSDADDDPWI